MNNLGCFGHCIDPRSGDAALSDEARRRLENFLAIFSGLLFGNAVRRFDYPMWPSDNCRSAGCLRSPRVAPAKSVDEAGFGESCYLAVKLLVQTSQADQSPSAAGHETFF